MDTPNIGDLKRQRLRARVKLDQLNAHLQKIRLKFTKKQLFPITDYLKHAELIYQYSGELIDIIKTVEEGESWKGRDAEIDRIKFHIIDSFIKFEENVNRILIAIKNMV